MENVITSIDLSEIEDDMVRNNIANQLSVFSAALKNISCPLKSEYNEETGIWTTNIDAYSQSSNASVKSEGITIQPLLYSTPKHSPIHPVDLKYTELKKKYTQGEVIYIKEAYNSIMIFKDDQMFNSWYNDYITKGLVTVLKEKELATHRQLIDAEILMKNEEPNKYQLKIVNNNENGQLELHEAQNNMETPFCYTFYVEGTLKIKTPINNSNTKAWNKIIESFVDKVEPNGKQEIGLSRQALPAIVFIYLATHPVKVQYGNDYIEFESHLREPVTFEITSSLQFYYNMNFHSSFQNFDSDYTFNSSTHINFSVKFNETKMAGIPYLKLYSDPPAYPWEYNGFLMYANLLHIPVQLHTQKQNVIILDSNNNQ